ncbi:MAG: phage tail terminator-like protein [Hafnia sp.]
MSNHYLSSRAALLAALKAKTGSTKIITDGSFDNKEPQYLRFTYMPSGDTPATLGVNGDDEFVGFAQVDCCTLASKGFKAHFDMIANIRSAYSYSVPLNYAGVSVNVTEVSAEPVPIDNDMYQRMALSIFFSYRVGR